MIDWDAVAAFVAKQHPLVQARCKQFARDSAIYKCSVSIEEYPPRITAEFAIGNYDGRRAEALSYLGPVARTPTDEEWLPISELMATIETECDMRVKQTWPLRPSWCMSYTFKPAYGTFEEE